MICEKKDDIVDYYGVADRSRFRSGGLRTKTRADNNTVGNGDAFAAFPGTYNFAKHHAQRFTSGISRRFSFRLLAIGAKVLVQ